eukprot:Skav210810  [mRNA]  locus=scaffold2924:148381:150981:- [translate_table: standard]
MEGEASCDDVQMSPDEAFAAFAFAAACAGGAGFRDMAETLCWAQPRGQSLYSAGLVVSFLGLPRVGSFARRMAIVQGLSQVAIASQAQ